MVNMTDVRDLCVYVGFFFFFFFFYVVFVCLCGVKREQNVEAFQRLQKLEFLDCILTPSDGSSISTGWMEKLPALALVQLTLRC